MFSLNISNYTIGRLFNFLNLFTRSCSKRIFKQCLITTTLKLSVNLLLSRLLRVLFFLKHHQEKREEGFIIIFFKHFFSDVTWTWFIPRIWNFFKKHFTLSVFFSSQCQTVFHGNEYLLITEESYCVYF